MDTGKKAAIGGTLLLLAVVAVRVGLIYHERNAPTPEPAAKVDKAPVSQDAYVFLKKKRPNSMADLKELNNTTVWVSAGGQLEYYPVVNGRAVYAKPAGTLLGAEPLVIQGAIQQVVPASDKKSAAFRIPAGDRQVLLTFHIPPSAQGPGQGDQLFAVPVGYHQDGQYTFSTDEIFFYDDPHQLYSYWGPQIWNSIDQHQAIIGMSEAEVQMALGQVSDSVSNDYGNRRVVYNNLGHPMDVIFIKDKATAVMPHQ